MDINIKTKFNVGDYAHRSYFGGNSLIKILGIEIYINKDNEIEIYYQFKPYSDSNMIDTIAESSLLSDEEI